MIPPERRLVVSENNKERLDASPDLVGFAQHERVVHLSSACCFLALQVREIEVLMTFKNSSTPPNSELTTISFHISPEGVEEIGTALRALLADFFTLYLKTKNFHWHMRGIHFRDFHLLLDEQGDQLFEATDAIAERARKIGATSLRSVGDITRHQRLSDNDFERVASLVMLSELCSDNLRLASFMRETHGICDQVGDLATASLIENWIDEAERRAWFLTATTATDA